MDFKKIREDSQEVEYLFGYPEMDRQLVVEKASQQGRPLDGKRDSDYAAVFVTIVRFYRSQGSWTEGGTYAA